MLKAIAPLLLLATPACVSAQSAGRAMPAPARAGVNAGEVTATDVMLAEHRQWEADHQRWHAQHLDMARRLEVIATTLKGEESEFARDAQELTTHGQALRTTTDPRALATLVANHVRVASQHARAAQAHHELLDEVTRLEALMSDDRSTQSDDDER